MPCEESTLWGNCPVRTALYGMCDVRIANPRVVKSKFKSRASGQMRFAAVAIAGEGKDPIVVEIRLGRRVGT